MARDIKGKKALRVWNLLSLVQARRMTDQFISSVKICTLHIREVKCNVTLQIHRYSKHEAKVTAGRDTDRETGREGQSSNKVYNTACRSICSIVLAA